MKPLEVVAVLTYAVSTWLLARNKVLGWWIGLVGIVAYIIVFTGVRLYADAGIQVFYLVTSLQAIWIWLRGGNAAENGNAEAERSGTGKPVTRAPRRVMLLTAALWLPGFVLLYRGLVLVGGAMPLVDALATSISLTAQLYLMERYLENWYLWILADLIYVPLYLSRGLYLSGVLYTGFLVLAVVGLRTFRRELRPQQEPI